MNETTIKLGNCVTRMPKTYFKTHLDIISETLRMRRENRIHEQLKKIASANEGFGK